MAKRKQKCIIEGCNEKANGRGLCSKDAAMAYGYVKQGKTTWEQLEKMGLAKPLPAKKIVVPVKPKKPQNKFVVAFREMFSFNK